MAGGEPETGWARAQTLQGWWDTGVGGGVLAFPLGTLRAPQVSSRGGTGVTFVQAGPPAVSWEPSGSGEACGCPWWVGFGDADGVPAERDLFCLTFCGFNFCLKSAFPSLSHTSVPRCPFCDFVVYSHLALRSTRPRPFRGCWGGSFSSQVFPLLWGTCLHTTC